MKHLPSSLADWIKQGDEHARKRRKRLDPLLALNIVSFTYPDAVRPIQRTALGIVARLAIPKTRERL